jgi:hypothetical protein
MSKPVVKLNYKGMGELLKSPQIQAMLQERMQPVASSVGSTVEVTVGRTRARAKVAKGSDYDEANTGALSRALDLAGGMRGTHIKNPRKTKSQR